MILQHHAQNWLLGLLSLLINISFTTHARFTEQLVAEALDQQHALLRFTFRASANRTGPDLGLFPAVLARIAAEHSVRSLEVSLTRGHKEDLLLSNATGDSSAASPAAPLPPAGLLLKAQFGEGLADTEPAFRGLARALEGLLRVPIERVAEDGVLAAPLVGWFGASAVARTQLYAAAPRLGCCSDQVAAWADLLPCRREAGLAALLTPPALAPVPYLSLRLRLSAAEGGSGSLGGGGRAAGCSTGCPGTLCSELSVVAVLPHQEPGTSAPPGLQAGGPQPAAGRATGGLGERVVRVLLRALAQPSLPAPCRAAASSIVQTSAGLLQPVRAIPPLQLQPSAGLGGDGPHLECSRVPELPGWVSCCLGAPGSTGGCAVAGQAQGAALAAQGSAAAARLPLQPPPAAAAPCGLQVRRRVVARGLAEADLVLSIRAGCRASPSPGNASTSGGSNTGSGGERCSDGPEAGRRHRGERTGVPEGGEEGASPASLLHVFQPVPWQLPTSLHTLRLWIDGQEAGPGLVHPLVAWHSILPAGGPSVPSVLELLLRLPDAAALQQGQHEVALSVGFRKRLLSVFQQPPDASRGVDIPPAVVTLVPGACALPPDQPAPGGGSHTLTGNGCATGLTSSSSRPAGWPSGSGWPWQQGGGAGCAVQQAHSAGHLVPLPIPDLSMPFNVCCFTGTLLAVYFGATLNALLRPPAEAARTETQGRRALQAKLRRVVALCLLGAALALYLDRDLQRRAEVALLWLGLGRESHPAGEQ